MASTPSRTFSSTSFVAEGLRPPPTNPLEFPASFPSGVELKFDPARHLQLEPPSQVKLLNFQDASFPYSPELLSDFPGLAYTRPFRILSDEGAQTLRGIVDHHAKRGVLKQNERNKCVRGLGYLSQFVREFTYSPELNNLLCQLANAPIWPHNVVMNHGHTNYGEPSPDAKAVDQWHVDSVEYVFVLILSDVTDMVGGELQVLQLADATGKVFDKLRVKGIPKDKVETVVYPKAGWCVLMQGSKILHSVTPVRKAVEPRMSFVQSFTNRNVLKEDRTRLACFREQFGDPAHIANLEYARHKAWRIKGQMQYIVEKLGFNASKEKLAELFKKAASELATAEKLLNGEVSDLPGFLVNEKDKVTKNSKAREDKSLEKVVVSKL